MLAITLLTGAVDIGPVPSVSSVPCSGQYYHSIYIAAGTYITI